MVPVPSMEYSYTVRMMRKSRQSGEKIYEIVILDTGEDEILRKGQLIWEQN